MSVTKRLQREIKANPAKAGGLGVLLLVAAYFWLPLLRGLIASPESPAATSTATPPPATASMPAATPAGQPGQPQTLDFDWQKLAALIDQDPLMRPAVDLQLPRDPFQSAAPPAVAESEKPVEQAPIVAAPVTPEDAGLVLSTVLIGARKKIAEIDGKSFTVGDRVPVPGNPGQVFRVVEIYPRRVVLESRGEQYELTIPRPLVDAVAESNSAGEGDHSAVEQHVTGDQGSDRPDAPKSTQ